MNEPGNVAPFRPKVVAENSEEMLTIGVLLKAMEGMQQQIEAMTEVIFQQDRRIEALEKAARPRAVIELPGMRK